MVIQTPLSTKGSQIVDANGKNLLLRGVNWFGIETELQVPHGLWIRDYKDMLAQIKSNGYNIIRLPFSVQALRGTSISGVDFGNGRNSELNGKTPLQAMDVIIQEAERQGLLIMLDCHRLNNSYIPELWYGDGFTEADWIDTWKMLANRYKNQANIVAADLKNEPHGRATWGTGDLTTDWRLAAERCGNAILAVNPNWLIVVEGISGQVVGQQLPSHWWGGNLEGVKNFPVRLNIPSKLVYSPHEYGAGVFNQPWFDEPSFPQNLRRRWQLGFYYIAEENIAPILIGEFGGRQVDAISKEGVWQRALVEFIKEKNLHFTYWCWNPNSGDTGGILLDDWVTVDAAKQQLLSTLLSGVTAPAPTPETPTPAPETPTPAPETPTPVPETPTPAPETPTPAPETPTPAPEIPTPAPETPTPAPETPTPAPETPTPAPETPTPTPETPTPTPEPNPSENQSQLKIELVVKSDWETGFCVEFRIQNTGITTINNWLFEFELDEAIITQGWNGNFVEVGKKFIVTLPNWLQILQPGQIYDQVGFCAQKLGANYMPKNILAKSL
jgi:endoglucanase